MEQAVMELSQRFFFSAAHTLEREIDAAGSARPHGHTYHAEVTIAGKPGATSGMVVDLGHVRKALGLLHDKLDHQFLNDVVGLGPATLENLCAYIARDIRESSPGLVAVCVWREASGDRCTMRLA